MTETLEPSLMILKVTVKVISAQLTILVEIVRGESLLSSLLLIEAV